MRRMALLRHSGANTTAKATLTVRRDLLVLLLLSLFVLAACGRNEVDEADLPTPVAVYTRDAASPGTEAQAAPAAADDAADDTAADDAAQEEETATEATDDSAEAVAAADDSGEEAATQETDAVGDAGTEGDASVDEATETETAVDEEAAAPEPTATTAPTATPEPTATTAATATTAPTATSAPTNTPAPTATPEPTATQAGASTDAAATDEFAGVPEGVAALIPGADVTRGEQLTLQNACIGCHNMDPNVPMAGPTWYNLAETAATRVEGESAATYLYNSIVHPNDYLVEGYVAGVMIQTYGDMLSEQDLADIVAYLLTLHGE